jgi:hypothetical protein
MDLTPEQLVSRVARSDAALVGFGAAAAVADGVRIGRDRATCEVAVLEASVSAVHARIERRGGTWCIVDLGSRNGTIVDGRPAAPIAELADGARLRLGDVELDFAVAGAAAAIVFESDDGRCFELHSGGSELRSAGAAVTLAPREHELVVALAARRRSRDPELAYVRGDELAPTLGFRSIEADGENVRELVRRVRRKLRAIGGEGLIETRRLAGYRLAAAPRGRPA